MTLLRNRQNVMIYNFSFCILLSVIFSFGLNIDKGNSSDSIQLYSYQNGNFLNNSQMILHDSYLYYIEYNQGGAIYRIKTDGSIHVPVDLYQKRGEVKNLFIHQNRLHYIDTTEWYSINLDNSDRREMEVNWNNERHHIVGMYPIKNCIIASTVVMNIPNDKYYILQLSFDGRVINKIYDGQVDNLNISGNYLYFTDSKKNKKLIRCELDGSNMEYLTDEAVAAVLVYNGWIYFNNFQGQLCKMSLNEKTYIPLGPRAVTAYNVAEGWIFFSSYVNDLGILRNTLYKIRTNGTGLQQVNDFPSTAIHIFDGKVYYRRDKGSHSVEIYVYSIEDCKHNRLDENFTIPVFSLNTTLNSITAEDEIVLSAGNRINYGGDFSQRNMVVLIPTDETSNLYQIPLDGCEATLIQDNVLMRRLQVANESIFYIHDSARSNINTATLFALPLDLKEISAKNQIVDVQVKDFLVIDSMLFFSNEFPYHRLFRQDLNTKERFIVSADVALDINLVNSWLYYIRQVDGFIIKVHIDGNDYQVLRETKVQDLIIGQKYLYFLDTEKHLYRMNHEGNELNKILSEPVRNYNLTENWIYYTPESKGVYRIRKDGTNKEKVLNQSAIGIYSHNDDAYFIAYADADVENKYVIYRILADGIIESFYPEKEVILDGTENQDNIISDKDKSKKVIKTTSKAKTFSGQIFFFLISVLILVGVIKMLINKKIKLSKFV